MPLAAVDPYLLLRAHGTRTAGSAHGIAAPVVALAG
jgi:hypothetical protein